MAKGSLHGPGCEARVGRPGPRHRRERVHRLRRHPSARRPGPGGRRAGRAGRRHAPTSTASTSSRSSATSGAATSVRKAVSGCRAVFHVAALYRFWARDPERLLRHQRRAAPATSSGRPTEAGVERLVYTSTVGTLGLEHVSRAHVRRRALVPRRPPPLRLLQALQVRGRARGAACHRRGPAGLAGPADLPRRPGRPRPHADRPARPRLPERPDPGYVNTVSTWRTSTTWRRGMSSPSSTAGTGAATSSAGRT